MISAPTAAATNSPTRSPSEKLDPSSAAAGMVVVTASVVSSPVPAVVGRPPLERSW